MTLSIYLAGPDVFLENALEVGERKSALCRQFGFEGFFPLDQGEAGGTDATDIFRATTALMQRCDIGLCNLTPFRGPSADVGTVFELGLLFALGKPVYGYSSATSVYLERVEAFAGPLAKRLGQRWDHSGHAVEDFDLTDNLMIERAIREAGGTIVTVEEKSAEALAAFKAFEACLEVLARDSKDGLTDGGT